MNKKNKTKSKDTNTVIVRYSEKPRRTETITKPINKEKKEK